MNLLQAKIMDYKQPSKIPESDSSKNPMVYPGMWRVPSNPQRCCIYRVPERLRRVNPEAYTPQLVLIGPFHHSLKSQALKSLGDITNTKLMGYLNMEEHKKIYLREFAQKFEEKNIIDVLNRMIKEDEEKIRESYSESTSWIKSPDFVKMILFDSVFIVEFILRSFAKVKSKIGDPLMDEPGLEITVQEDLILLENQLPFFILEKLFDPIIEKLFGPIIGKLFGRIFPGVINMTVRTMIIMYFDLHNKIGNNLKFNHFTDLKRSVYVETLPAHAVGDYKQLKHLYNADKLHGGGVKFEAVEEKFSLEVSFENGCLKIPCLWLFDNSEMELRNIMALEQSHYPYTAHVCDYFMFMDFLIDTEKDVDLLIEKGIIKNWMGQPNSVAVMVNKLCLGIAKSGSNYLDIVARVNAHYSDPRKRALLFLNRVYFGNIWIGTATVAAILLLLFTFIQVVTSVLSIVLK